MMDDRESKRMELRAESLIPLLLLLYLPYQFLTLPRKTTLEWYSVLSEGSVVFFLLLALWLISQLRHHGKVYWPLVLGFSALLLSAVTDLLDEVLLQSDMIEILFEDIPQLLGYPFVVAGFYQWISINHQLRSELQHQVATDYLTNTLNRRGFMGKFEQEIMRSRRYGSALSLIWFDLDHFKALNDRFGHHVGDEVLVTIARLTGHLLRKVDVFGRMGGEEFCVLMPETGISGARDVAEKLRQAFEACDYSPDLVITASFGVGEYRPGDEPEQFLRRVDNALYRAKDEGRNCVVVDESLLS